MSAGAAALRLNASSPQAFHRTVRTVLGMTLSKFRVQYRGETMLARFRDTLITPYADVLRTFDPLRTDRPAPDTPVRDDRPRGGSGTGRRHFAEPVVLPAPAWATDRSIQ